MELTTELVRELLLGQQPDRPVPPAEAQLFHAGSLDRVPDSSADVRSILDVKFHLERLATVLGDDGSVASTGVVGGALQQISQTYLGSLARERHVIEVVALDAKDGATAGSSGPIATSLRCRGPSRTLRC